MAGIRLTNFVLIRIWAKYFILSYSLLKCPFQIPVSVSIKNITVESRVLILLMSLPDVFPNEESSHSSPRHTGQLSAAPRKFLDDCFFYIFQATVLILKMKLQLIKQKLTHNNEQSC